jgi:hypothetical protein
MLVICLFHSNIGEVLYVFWALNLDSAVDMDVDYKCPLRLDGGGFFSLILKAL